MTSSGHKFHAVRGVGFVYVQGKSLRHSNWWYQEKRKSRVAIVSG